MRSPSLGPILALSALLGALHGLGCPLEAGAPHQAEPIPRPGWLGFGFCFRPDPAAAPGSYPAGDGLAGWLLVQSVEPAGPAAAAGLRVGDLVTAIDGRRVDLSSPRRVVQLFSRVGPGQQLLLQVARGDRLLSLAVVAREMPEPAYRRWKRLWREVRGAEEEAGDRRRRADPE